MTLRGILAVLALSLGTSSLTAQSGGPVAMPAGSYVIQARDTAKAETVAMRGWPFVLKGNGNFTITTPDSLTFTGKLVQKDGIATYTDQSCDEAGQYVVRQERGGYAFDAKAETCSAGWTKLLFVPSKPKR